MATVNASTIFPSIKFISTDGLGDLGETVGSSAVAASRTIDGLTFTAVTAGAAGNSITIELIEGQSANGVVGVEISAVGNAITIATELGASTYTQGDVENAYLAASTDVTDLITLSVANSATALIGTFTSANLQTGADATSGDLDPDSEYVLIKKSDYYDLESGEETDGRKLVWGAVHRASEVFAGLSDPPENFTIARTSPVAVQQGTALRQVYTITAIYAIEGLDLKAEA